MWLIDFHVVTVPLGLITAWMLNSVHIELIALHLADERNVIPFPGTDEPDDTDNSLAA